MKKTFAAAVAAAALIIVPAGAASANNGNDKPVGAACVNLGEIHSGLAKQGLIGKPGVAAHNPGQHRGMAGFAGCAGGE